MKKLLTLLLVVVLSMTAFIGCKDLGSSSTNEGPAVEITLNKTEVVLAIGEQFALEAEVTNSEESVTWASSNASVVKVNKFGMLQALALGTADITATIGSTVATCKVSVNPLLTADVESVTLVAPVEGVDLGDLTSKKVSFTANPELAAGEELTVVSSDPAIAVYEEVELADGTSELRIVAKAQGSAIITATAPNGAKAEIAVSVQSLNAAPTALTFEIATEVAVPEWCGVFLAGTLSAWGPAEGFELARIDDTHFKGTFTFDFSEIGDAARNAEYKFILSSKLDNGDGTFTYGADTGWERVNGSNVDNRKIFVNNDETIALEGIVFQSVPANPVKPDITNHINITLVFTAPVEHAVHLIGPFCNWDLATSPAFTTTDNLTFNLSVEYVGKADTFECKINNGTWDWNYGSSDGITWTQGGDNYMLPLTGEVDANNERDVNVTWNIFNGSADAVVYNNQVTINVTFANEVTHDVYLVGGVNGWANGSADWKFETADNKTFTITFSYESKDASVDVKITDGDWDAPFNYGMDNEGNWIDGSNTNFKLSLEGTVDGTTRTIVHNFTINN